MLSLVQMFFAVTQARNVRAILASRHEPTSASMLPSFPATDRDASAHASLEISMIDKSGGESSWWFRAGDRIYHAPSKVALLQSAQQRPRITDYYYAYGSASAVPEKLLRRRVGGEGRLHIFYMPEGLELLQRVNETRGSRRSSLSQLRTVRNGMRLNTTFPPYRPSSSYVSPLSKRGQKIESAAVASITGNDTHSILASLVSLPSRNTPTRSYNNPDASATAQDFIRKKFESFGLTTCLHKFEKSGIQMANVVAFVPGRTSDTVTLGAHYDSRPYEGAAPGAEDNGSGVAALLAAAKAFMGAAAKPIKSIFFVAFAAEEIGMVGSAAFVHDVLNSGKSSLDTKCRPSTSFLQSTRPKGQQHLAIVMDEVGWKSPSLPQATVNLESYDSDITKATLENMAQASMSHNGKSLRVVHSGSPFGSDHMSFLENGIGAVLAINGDDEAYPAYHASNDVIGNVDSTLMAMIAKMNLGALMRLAGLDA